MQTPIAPEPPLKPSPGLTAPETAIAPPSYHKHHKYNKYLKEAYKSQQLDIDSVNVKPIQPIAPPLIVTDNDNKKTEKPLEINNSVLKRSSSKIKLEPTANTSQSQYTSQTAKLMKEALVSKKILKSRHIKLIDAVGETLSENWSGVFTLKKHYFPTKFFFSGRE